MSHADPTTGTVPGSAAAASPTWRRALALLWLGQVVSHVGDSLFLVGIFFLALEVTGSKSQSGLTIATSFLPALAFGLFAGAFVDRYDRRRVMIAADLLRGLAVAAIPALYLTGHLGIAALAVAMFALATGSTLFNPAIKALIPEIAPRVHLTAAAAVFQVSEFTALVAGPALAALAIPRLGHIHLFTLDAATFFFSAACLTLLPAEARRLAHRPAATASEPLAEFVAGIAREAAVGLRTTLANPVLRAVLLLAAIENLLIMGLAHVATPLLVKERLGLGADAYARAQTFFFLGMVAASTSFWALARRAPKGPMILIGIMLDGLTFIPLGLCTTLGQLQVAQFVHALSIPMIIIPRTVLIQQSVPGPMHGRTFALLNVTVFGMTALSSGGVGLLAEHVAPQTLFVVLGTLGILPGILGFGFSALRRQR